MKRLPKQTVDYLIKLYDLVKNEPMNFKEYKNKPYMSLVIEAVGFIEPGELSPFRTGRDIAIQHLDGGMEVYPLRYDPMVNIHIRDNGEAYVDLWQNTATYNGLIVQGEDKCAAFGVNRFVVEWLSDIEEKYPDLKKALQEVK